MSIGGSDLGVLGDLAGAVGLTDDSGSFREDWLSNPGAYLSSVLADQHQRESLLTFVDNVLGGSTQSKAPDGTTWLPVVERSAPDFHLFVVLDDQPADYVGIGLGLRFSSLDPAATIAAHVPIFRAAKKGHTVDSPLLIGTAGAIVTLTAELTTDPAAPVPGQAHLGGIRLEVAVPTGGGASPTLSLTFKQLQMPGATTARDLSASASSAEQLEGSILDLVLGLVRAQAEALPPGPLPALAGLLGLRDGLGIPALPFADFASEGVTSLATWFGQVLGAPASRTAWVGQLAALIGGALHADQVSFTIGPATLNIGVGVTIGSDAHTRLTPSIGIALPVNADIVVRADADLCMIDLGTGAATALPNLALQLWLGHRPDGGAILLDQAGPPAVRVETVRAGFALSAARKPTLVLAADKVTIGTHTHDTLDLSTPDAIADAGGVVLGDIADEILGQLGAAADAVRILLGLSAPLGHPEVPTIAFGAFLSDPLGAIAGHWQTLVHDHPAAIPAVVTTLRDLIADAAEAGAAVDGSGSAADPWHLGLAGPVDLQTWIDGDRLSLALAITLVVDTLGQRCTRVESSVRATIVEIDLATRGVTFLAGITSGFKVRARGRPQASFVTSAFTLTADSVGLQLLWAPDAGLHAQLSAPNLALDFGQGPLTIPLPTIDGAGHVTLSSSDWDKVERLLGAFAMATGIGSLRELVGMFGWVRRRGARGAPARLRLAELVVDPETAVVDWFAGIAVRDQDLLVRALSLLANLVGGSAAGIAGILHGTGRPSDPWLVPMSRVGVSAQLAVWVGPAGPLASVATEATRLHAWRPGLEAVDSADLAAALQSEAKVADDVAALLAGRPDIEAGLEALVVRWAGTDGRVVPPGADIDGVIVHQVADQTSSDLVSALDLDDLLDRAPDTVVHVAVAAPDALPWPDAPADRIVDLTTPNIAPDGFTPPAPATGDWFLALGNRAACRLASSDPDGIAGQAARVQRILAGLGGVAGGLVVVADAESGHAARRASDAVPAVTDVVLLGTPAGPVSFAVLDENPAADTLRLLARLLPALSDDVDDDQDLGLGRGLVTALTSLLTSDDPTRELQPPSPLPSPPRAGLNLHAVFGVVNEASVRRALTAIVAAGLAERSQARAAQPFADPDELHVAIRIPLPSGTSAAGDPVVDGYAQFELAEVAIDDLGVHLTTARNLSVHCGFGRQNGWLVGGPDPSRAPGVIPDKELRRVSLDIDVPLGTTGDGSAAITLHEPRAYGIDRERWLVQAVGAVAPPGVDAATPALPEVRILLSGLAGALTGPTAGPAASLANALKAIHLLGPTGSSVPDAIDHLLHDPIAHLDAVLTATTDRQMLVAALRALFGASGTAPDRLQIGAGPATIDLDLAARRVSLAATASPDAFGLVSWSAHLTLDGAAHTIDGDFTIGDVGATVAGGLDLHLTTPFRAALRWYRPGLANPEILQIWPSPDAGALARGLARIVPAELLRVALESLRELDADTRPILDAGLLAIGLLSDPAADGSRRILLPLALIADPAAWFEHNSVLGGSSGLVPARLIAVMDSLKPIIGIAGDSGQWRLTNGVTVVADTDAGGAARLTLTVDSSQFAPIPGAGRLVVGGSLGLAFPSGAPPRPAFDMFIGIDGATTPGRQAVHVGFGTGVQVFVRPATGADIPIYPNAAGLGQLAQSAITQALPFILDRLAGLAGHAGISGQVGTLVATLGDALGIRVVGHFSGPALQAWAADPAAAIVARLPSWSTVVIGQIAAAIGPLLPGGLGASVVGASLQVQVGVVTILVTPTPFAIEVSGEVDGVPAVSSIEFGVGLSSAGLTSLDVQVGPAEIDAGGVMIRPFFGVHAGTAPGGGRRAELSLGVGEHTRVGARWRFGDRFDLVVVDSSGVSDIESTDAALVAVTLLEAVLDIVASFAMTTDAFTTLLGKTVGSSTVRDALRGVVLKDADPTQLDANLFDPARLLARVQRLAVNVAEAAPSVDIDGLVVGLAADDLGGGAKAVGVRLSLDRPVKLVDSDVTVSLETDARWIHPPSGPAPPDGIVLDVLNVGAGAGAITFAPGVSVNGLGLRFGKNDGPLLDIAGLTLGSIALHLFGRIGDLPPAGGAEIQLSDLGCGVGGASGGNPVAQGVVGDSGKGPNALQPKFSPALAVQKWGTGPVLVSLRAGDGSGPWWLAIQKGFGPLYIEQVGFGVTVQQDVLKRISILLDGRVSILGLTAAVDDLQLTFVVASNASVFDPSRWAVDLGGLAISSNLGGLLLEGGLKKFGDGDTVQYVGMLMGRFAVYGLSVFGGYGHGVENGQRYASFFAFGAVNGPIGGPPAFFVTGIGGGLGINRQIVIPSDLSHFDQFPFIKALDPAARPSQDPMAELTSIATSFPQALGSFWFAAGISFTSFALVDGIVVLSVEVGDGLEIALFGLARMALPRPQFPLVSIELGLIARFSSKEGVLWVQAQLTDNSWLLYPDVRLTGGFAYVMWFLGANAGQFVLTIGGYHPRFHRDGYPDVPRLGLQWRVGPFLTIKGESYFALTSEAIMAGARIEVSAEFGPAWAHLVLGADGIVYYDPFHFEVEVYASISAGVTIDVWIGTITISISIGARILLEGPNFHGIATFSVGPIDLSVEFGEANQPPHPPLPWADFVRKYLEEAAPGVARVLTAVPGKGSLPPGTGAGGATDTGTADGSAEKPFTVFAEFEIMVTSTIPTSAINLGAAPLAITPSSGLGLAPMNIANAGTAISLTLGDSQGVDHTAGLSSAVHHGPAFPIGVWGLPQPNDDRKVPSGDVIDAIDGVLLSAVAVIPAGLPPIDYRHRVEAGVRLPLPFVHESSERPQFMTDATQVAALLPASPTVDQVFSESGTWMSRAGNGRTAIAALRNERASPPRFGSLTDGLAAATPPQPDVALKTPGPVAPVDTRVRPPTPIAVITWPVFQAERPAIRTTATRAGSQLLVTKPPTLDSVAAKMDLALPAQLHVVQSAGGQLQNGTIVAAGAVPLTRAARGGVAAMSGRGAAGDGQARLASLLPSESVHIAPTLRAAFASAARAAKAAERAKSRRVAARAQARSGTSDAGAPDASLLAGEIAVLRFPNAARDLDAKATRPRLNVIGGPTRIVALTHGGEVVADTIALPGTTRVPGFAPPLGTERVAVAVAGAANQDAPGLSGWIASTALAYIGWATALAAGAVVRVENASVTRTRHRRTAGWIRGAELVDGTSLVITRFVDPITVVVIALDDPGAEGARNLSLGLAGASRAKQADGTSKPPSAVVRANRTFLTYDIVPDGKNAVTVTVGSESGWHLAGVMGGNVPADVVAGWVTGRGIDAVVRAVLPGTGGSRTLQWIGVQGPPIEGLGRPGPRLAPRGTSASRAKDRRQVRRTSPKSGKTSAAKAAAAKTPKRAKTAAARKLARRKRR
jgi:hypothetical protein